MLAFIVKLRFGRNISGSKPANVVGIQFQVFTKHERKPAIDCVASSLAACHEAAAQASPSRQRAMDMLDGLHVS
jgi:hypothetical protein